MDILRNIKRVGSDIRGGFRDTLGVYNSSLAGQVEVQAAMGHPMDGPTLARLADGYVAVPSKVRGGAPEEPESGGPSRVRLASRMVSDALFARSYEAKSRMIWSLPPPEGTGVLTGIRHVASAAAGGVQDSFRETFPGHSKRGAAPAEAQVEGRGANLAYGVARRATEFVLTRGGKLR
jgi:hypothetical protein